MVRMIGKFKLDHKKPKRSKTWLWCPGGGHVVDAGCGPRRPRIARCEVCNRRLELFETECCGGLCEPRLSIPRHKYRPRAKHRVATPKVDPSPIKPGSNIVTTVGAKNYRDYTPTQRRAAKKRMHKRGRQRARAEITREVS